MLCLRENSIPVLFLMENFSVGSRVECQFSIIQIFDIIDVAMAPFTWS